MGGVGELTSSLNIPRCIRNLIMRSSGDGAHARADDNSDSVIGLPWLSMASAIPSSMASSEHVFPDRYSLPPLLQRSTVLSLRVFLPSLLSKRLRL